MITCPSLLTTVIKWRLALEDGEFIEFRNTNWNNQPRNTIAYWCEDYLAFNSITQYELNLVCQHTNNWFKALDLPYRVGNSMGEIKSGLIPQRKLF